MSSFCKIHVFVDLARYWGWPDTGHLTLCACIWQKMTSACARKYPNLFLRRGNACCDSRVQRAPIGKCGCTCACTYNTRTCTYLHITILLSLLLDYSIYIKNDYSPQPNGGVLVISVDDIIWWQRVFENTQMVWNTVIEHKAWEGVLQDIAGKWNEHSP